MSRKFDVVVISNSAQSTKTAEACWYSGSAPTDNWKVTPSLATPTTLSARRRGKRILIIVSSRFREETFEVK